MSIKNIKVNGLNVKRIEMGGGKLFEAMRDYEELEWIDTQGVTITTDIKVTSDTSIEVICTPATYAEMYFFGYTDNIAKSYCYAGSENFLFTTHGNVNTNGTLIPNTLAQCVITVGNGSQTINGREVGKVTMTNFSDKAISLLDVNVDNGRPYKPFHGRFHCLTIKSAGTHIHLIVPARRLSDNAIGMYDTISKRFFANQGSGSFIAGPPTGRFY